MNSYEDTIRRTIPAKVYTLEEKFNLPVMSFGAFSTKNSRLEGNQCGKKTF
jgi:hypothetical protein